MSAAHVVQVDGPKNVVPTIAKAKTETLAVRGAVLMVAIALLVIPAVDRVMVDQDVPPAPIPAVGLETINVVGKSLQTLIGILTLHLRTPTRLDLETDQSENLSEVSWKSAIRALAFSEILKRAFASSRWTSMSGNISSLDTVYAQGTTSSEQPADIEHQKDAALHFMKFTPLMAIHHPRCQSVLFSKISPASILPSGSN